MLCGAACQEDRKAAREEFWALRGNAPDIQQVFDLEVGDDPLMEPLEVVLKDRCLGVGIGHPQAQYPKGAIGWEELRALRGNAPDIQQLFDLEVGDDPLMEPLEVV